MPQTDVWLVGWQVEEDHLDLTIGERVAWDTIPMDEDWVTELFADGRRIPLALDTYADGTRAPEDPSWVRISGTVERIERITAEYVQSDGLVAVPGSARSRPVPSLRHRPVEGGRAVGFVVRIAGPATGREARGGVATSLPSGV
jgi:hypothetical protein